MTVQLAGQLKPRGYRWTSEEYYRMSTLGLFENKRVELIEGILIQLPPIGPEHSTGVTCGDRAVAKAFGPDCTVRVQQPLHCPEDSEPEPDLAVVPGDPRRYRDRQPTTALLVIEVSDTSLDYDRTTKSRIYARAGVSDYWVVDVRARKLEVYRTPLEGEPGVFHYSETIVLDEGDSVVPLATPDPIAVADLLP